MINLGINLGSNRTVYSICGYNQNGTFLTKTLLNDASKRETPSLLVFTNKERKAGTTAITDFKSNAESSFINISRLIGINNSPDIEKELKYSYVKADIKNENNKKKVIFKFKLEDKFIQAESNEIIASYIQKINKQYLKYNSDFQFENLTISIPDFFSLAQKQAIKIILKAVGAQKINIINETTAITFYYGYNKYKDFFKSNKNNVKNVIFVDSGNSKTTFFLSQFKFNEFKVLYVKGRDFDEAIFKYAQMQYKIEFGQDFPKDIPKKKVLLFQQIQKCRENLSVNRDLEIRLDSFFKDKDFIMNLSQDKLEGLIHNLLNIFVIEFYNFFETCKKKIGKIDNIEMVGGLLRTPIIEKCITKISNIKLSKTNLVDECTAIGAALFNFYYNWTEKKEQNFPLYGFKNIFGYNGENIYYKILNSNSLEKYNFNKKDNSEMLNIKELNEKNDNRVLAFEKGDILPKQIKLKLDPNENLEDCSQKISFFRYVNQKNIIPLINYIFYLPNSLNQSTPRLGKNNPLKFTNKLNEYSSIFYLNHCGYFNLYKIEFKNEITPPPEYIIESQELINENDCEEEITKIKVFLNKIEKIDKEENIIQEEKNKLSSSFYEQRNLIRSHSLEKIKDFKDNIKSIEKDLRDLNKINDKDEVQKGIRKIKEKLENVKRSVSQHNNKNKIINSMIYDRENDFNYYREIKKPTRKKKEKKEERINMYTYKEDENSDDDISLIIDNHNVPNSSFFNKQQNYKNKAGSNGKMNNYNNRNYSQKKPIIPHYN